MYAYGLGLNSAQSGLGAGPDGGLNGYVAVKFANLTQTITAAGSQIDPNVAATVQGYVNQSRDYFNGSYQSDTPGGYACALNSLASADIYLRANLTGFHFAAPPAGNPNPAGDVDGRIANLFLSINSYFLLQPANMEWPTSNVPPCVTLSVSPASVIAGNSANLTWGAAAPAYPLSFPPAQCTLSASDGTFTTSTTVAPSGAAVSTGQLATLGAYTASIECTGAPADTVPGLATATAAVIAPPVLTSIAVTPPATSIGDLFTQQFAATGTYSFGPTQDLTNSVTWTSSNLGVASISTGGLAACHAAGSVAITATSGAKSGSASLTCQKVLSGMSLSANGASTKLAVGGTLQITAQGTYTDGSNANLSGAATWSTSNPTVATVSGGLVTAVAAGQADISASINDPIAGTVTAAALTVTVAQPVTLQKLVLSPSYSVSISKGSSKQFTLLGCFSDGSTRNLTGTATWTSSNTAVATVSAGLVTGVYKGSAKIYASYGGMTASPVSVTVTSSDWD
jgi:hypothetical protein